MGSGGTGAGGGGAGAGGGGASGTGDVYGDLVKILRHATTGQPILERREILDAQDVRVIAYCPVALTADGQEVPFLVDSCDPDPTYTTVAIDNFGRLDGARTVETNFRKHFDEVIKKINAATRVDRDTGGRLNLYTCTTDATTGAVSCSWVAIDSSQENMAVYQRIMKYGHLQTDPLEVDTASGDPSLGVQYHPALKPEDHAKFTGAAAALLPSDAASCFASMSTCVLPQPLQNEDFVMAAGALAGAADKTGLLTVDLVQYFNRMVDIPVATATTAAPAVTLPALIRDGPGSSYHEASCATDQCDALGNLPVPANERFVDYGSITYARGSWFNVVADMLRPQPFTAGVPSTSWVLGRGVPIMPWLEYRNPNLGAGANVTGFVRLTNDSLRTIELVHNYKIPADLWDFAY